MAREEELRWLWRMAQRLRDDPRGWYAPHGKQRAFHAVGVNAKERLFLAGNRVGKTLAGAVEVGFHLTGLYPDWWQGVRFEKPIQAWAASVTKEATRDILQATYLGGLGRRGAIPKRLVLGQVSKSGVSYAADTVLVRHVSGGVSTLGFKSFDQGRESFQGTSREVIHLDEEPPMGVYEECLLRTLDTGGQVLLTMTPLMGMTDVVRHFLEEEAAHGRAVIRASWGDAEHLMPLEVARLRKSLRPHEVDAREHGVPQLGRGKVFGIPEVEVRCARFDIPSHWKRFVGMDFGWTNPTAAVWLAHDAANDVVYVTDIYKQAEQPPSVHAAAVLARGKFPTVGDPAGQSASQRDGVSLLDVYAQAGLTIERADNDVEAGVMAMLERLRTGRLRVFDDLHDWWGEYRLYARDDKGRIKKRDDHLLDATRYGLMSGIVLAREVPVLRRESSNFWTT